MGLAMRFFQGHIHSDIIYKRNINPMPVTITVGIVCWNSSFSAGERFNQTPQGRAPFLSHVPITFLPFFPTSTF